MFTLKRLNTTFVNVCFEQNEASPHPLSGSIRFVETSAVCLSVPLMSRTDTLNLNQRGTAVQLCMYAPIMLYVAKRVLQIFQITVALQFKY